MSTTPANPYLATADHLASGNEADQRRAAVLATMALAYEQRTANLIAAFAALSDNRSETILANELPANWLSEQIAARLLPVTEGN